MSSNIVECGLCGHKAEDYLGDHLLEVHGVDPKDYDGEIMSARLKAKLGKSSPRRRSAPDLEGLSVDIAGIEFPVNIDVPADACLPLPAAYRFPKYGKLAQDIKHAAISVRKQRHGMIHGMPGTGKDAFIHAISAQARIPCMIRSIKPGVNIQSWFYSRSFNKEGTEWERGPLLDALTKGYEVKDDEGNVIKRIPYLILITDFDRADRAQAEHLRLIMDTTKGRVEGPQGATEDVLPGTTIWATGNTAGSGDSRGRMVSSNIIDASILDRFDRVYQFHDMSWKDEQVICKEKFPLLVEKCDWIFDQVGRCTTALRKSIANRTLYAEFSHRAVCSILEHAQDLIEINAGKPVPEDILVGAARVWLDRLGDETTRKQALSCMDSHIPGGAMDDGNGPDVDDDFNF